MISASIVLYNTKKELINRVVNSYSPSAERKLYLIDNSPSKCDGLYSDNSNIEYIYIGKNIGYGAGHNIGIKKAIKENSKYHIVLNPDIMFDKKIIDELVKYANLNMDIVYMLPKVIYPNGELQYLCKLLPTPMDLIFRRFLPNIGVIKRRNDKYILKDSGYNHIINPPCLSGCFMFMRVETIKENDIYFDDRFFMYCEDFDLIRRLHRVGKTIFYPNVTIIHDHARDSYKNKKMLLEHIKSACKYFNKYGWILDKERNKENRKILAEIKNINLIGKVENYERKN